MRQFISCALAVLALCVLANPGMAQVEKKPVAGKQNPKPVVKPVNPKVLIKTSMGDIEAELFADGAPKTVKNFVDLAEGKKKFTDVKTGDKVKKPFFDNIAFHRVIANFMLQGGCPRGNGMGDPGYKFEDEINAKGLGLDKKKFLDANGAPDRSHNLQQPQVQKIVGSVHREMGITSQEIFEKKKDEFMKRIKAMTYMDALMRLGYKYNDKITAYHPKRGSLAMANSGPATNGSQFFINVVDTPFLTGKHTVFGKVTKGMDIVDKISKVAVDARSKPTTPVTILSIRLMKTQKPAPKKG